MIKTIYLIRHGETDFNLQGVVQGSGIDSDLNQKGQNQAKAFFQHYKDVPFDKIYVSELKRTHQSVEGFIENGIPYEVLSGLNEISWGKREGKVPNSSDDEYYGNLIHSWRQGFTHITTDEGESPEQVAKRQKVAIKHIKSQESENTVLICMHGRAIRIMLAHLTKRPLAEMDNFKHQNLCLYKLEYHYHSDQWKVILSNNIDHLTEDTKPNLVY